MAVVTERTRKGKRRPDKKAQARPQIAALLAFATLEIIAPLAFGAVDRLVQIGLAAAFVIALLVVPPKLPTLNGPAKWLLLGLAAVLVFKEFAPASLFGIAEWRSVLTGQYGVVFPLTHHPEPGRAVDALLAMLLGVLWFLWVRTLAARRENRTGLVWTMFAAGALVAGVSFLTAGIDPKAIYGLRYTQSWMGFGPFPNRNHTACFLAMATVAGVGCLISAGRRKQWAVLVLGASALMLTIAALLRTQSRGGLIAVAAGLAILGVLVLSRFRNARIVMVGVAAALVGLAGVLSFGGTALERFSSSGAEQSSISRIFIWQDAIRLWEQAPVLGHGVGTFASVFPLAQTLPLDNQVVLHPESSWVQWLVELGALPLVLGVGLAIAALVPFLRELYARQSSFFLPAASLAAGATLLIHSFIDVPGHRWGTALLGLAALAVACPAEARLKPLSRKVALVPMAAALLWSWPLIEDRPAWSPTTLARLLDRSRMATIPEAVLSEAVAWFPLNSSLHELLGAELLHRHGHLSKGWAEHLQLAARLRPGSWSTPLRLAQICRRASPGHSLHFWQMALERAGWRRGELFARALTETREMPGSIESWESYAESHPELLLVFALHQPADGKRHFDQWWTARASANDLSTSEIQSFLAIAPRFASEDQIVSWARRRHETRERDYRAWASMLHERGADSAAWTILSFSVPDPDFPTPAPGTSQAQLEDTWRHTPENLVNAQATAQARLLSGNRAGMEEIILEVGARAGSPPWFRAKAAHLLASKDRASDAVRLLLKED